MCLKKEELLINEVIHFLVNSEMKEGDRLPPERELSEMFHASRNTLRSAIKNLQAKGILEVRPRSGYYLKTDLHLHKYLIAYKDDKQVDRIGEQLEAFFLFEPVVVSLCSERINKKQINELELYLVGLSKAILEGEATKIAQNHKVIYQAIAMACNNQLMLLSLDQFETMFNAVSQVLAHLTQDERSEIFAAHVNLVNGIKNKEENNAACQSRNLIITLANLLYKYEGIAIPAAIQDHIIKKHNDQ